MTKPAAYQEISIMPGVMPSTDATPSDIPCWADALHVRFDPSTGRVRKIGGWEGQDFDYGGTVEGVIRTVYSVTINNRVYTALGTNSGLYSLIGSRLVNITPLQTEAITIADSLDTHYDTLVNDPVSTVNGSAFLTIADADAAYYRENDSYTLSGATAVNGVPDTDINATHIVRGVGVGTIMVLVATSATSTGSGGGASVVRSSGLVTVNDAAHGLVDGQRVGIADAATFGGITDTQMNAEFIIRNVTTDTFDVPTTGTATSLETGGGGSDTEYFPPIEGGAVDQGLGQGYGAGYYGVGLYGTALVSVSGQTYPRIWFMDRFGDKILMTAGNGTEVYEWGGDTTTAPVVISGAPTDINYIFVSDGILVTLGHDVENKIFASDTGNYAQWVASSTNQVFEDIIEGAGRFISHAPVDGYNLLFTEQQTYTFKYIGGALVWQTLLLDSAIGIIGPMARVSVNGIAYWMGQENFYMFRGGKIEAIPSNIGAQSSMLRYVFDDLNYSQRFKIFAWYNEKFDEIWFHYPSEDSSECDRVARYSRRLQFWVPDMLDRTAGEYPAINLSNPRLANMSDLFVHESGNDADGVALEWYARTKKYLSGKDTAVNTQVVPDNVVNGDISLQVRTFNYPQSTTPMNDKTYTIAPTTERVPVQLNGRYWDYTISGDALGQAFLMGQWFEEPQKGATAP